MNKLPRLIQFMRIRAKEAHMFQCFSTKSRGLRSHKEKEWPSLLCLLASGEKDQDGLENRTTASCVPQPGELFSEQQPGSNSSKHTEVPQSSCFSHRKQPPIPWFLRRCRLWGSHGEGVKGAMSHTASRLNLSRHTADVQGPLCNIA